MKAQDKFNWTAKDWADHGYVEKDFQAWLIKQLKRLEARRDGLYLMKVKQANEKGVPDIIACVRGKFVAMELKTSAGRLSTQQHIHMQRILDAGGVYEVVRCWETARMTLISAGYSSADSIVK